MADVIMPALGMAQETGLILAWHKQPGDAVKVGDVLMEVETDKAAMEVEAQADGFLTELRADAGEEVPVGTVIAVISGDSNATVASPSAGTPEEPVEAGARPEPVAEAVPQAKTPDAAPHAPGAAASSPSNKVLASPKAKRLAAERGIDLAHLASAGHPQPYRSADLERAAAAQPREQIVAAGAPARLVARASVDGAPFDDFCRWLSGEAGVATGMVFGAFAAGSLRSAAGLETISVLVTSPRKPSFSLTDPDRFGLNSLEEDETGTRPDLIVYDLTGSRLTGAELAATEAPTLTIGREDGRLAITLSAARGQLEDDALIACLDAFAGRLEEPLRQLL